MLGEFVRDRREILNMTRDELANKTDVTSSYISLIETNKRRIGKGSIDKFAKALKVSRDTIVAENKIIESDYNRYPSARNRFRRRKADLDFLIFKMEETLSYLKSARQVLDKAEEDIIKTEEGSDN